MYGRRRVNNFYVYARPSIHCLLDFLKNLRFPFPVPVVGPSTKDFYPLQCAKFTGEISLLCGFYPITNGFTDAPSIKPDHAT